MKFIKWSALMLLVLGCGVFLLLMFSEQEAGLTLAELTPDRHDRLPSSGLALGDVKDMTAVSLASLDVEPIFYGVLALCGAVLAFRVVISVFRSVQEQRSMAQRPSAPPVTDGQPQLLRADNRAEAADFAARRVKVAEVDAERPGARTPTGVPEAAVRLRDQVPRYRRGPVAHMMYAFAGIVGAFGMIAIALVYFRLTPALREQVLQRATVTAVNVSDGAPAYLIKKNSVGLRELLRKQASRPGLAYIVVEDRAGRIFAHSFAVLPGELSTPAAGAQNLSDSRRTLQIGGNAVHEVMVPILEGRGGAVRVGVWRERIDDETNETMISLIKWLAIVACGGILMAMFFAWRINRPIFKLVSAAKAISGGALDTPTPNIADPGEIGELSRALERLRSSMKAALIRLSR